MMWIEMSKDKTHGGSGWEFTKCLWAPAYKLVGKTNKHVNWAYWNCIKDVRAGDIVLHLRGDKNPKFVGQSIAETDGFETIIKPPDAGPNWDYAERFYRVNLKDYVPFKQEINLSKLFDTKNIQLTTYYKNNKEKSLQNKRLLFYAIQINKLRRQNGAYLSNVDDELYRILFEEEMQPDIVDIDIQNSVSVSEGLNILPFRKGQSDFARNVIKNFGCKCCFPGCNVTDRNFLVGSHIARWADCPEFRGETANGLCFCLMHDKAFEIGLFTINDEWKIDINETRIKECHVPVLDMRKAHGLRIKDSLVLINKKYLSYHWTRIGYKPKED